MFPKLLEQKIMALKSNVIPGKAGKYIMPQHGPEPEEVAFMERDEDG
jgi:hypothetical protein